MNTNLQTQQSHVVGIATATLANHRRTRVLAVEKRVLFDQPLGVGICRQALSPSHISPR